MVDFEYPAPSTSMEELKKLEKEWNLALPEAYKGFLLKHNGGFPVQTVFNLEEPITVLRFYYEISGDYFSIQNMRQVLSGSLPPELLAVGQTVDGRIICLSCHGSDYGSVYLWGDQSGADKHQSPNRSLVQLATDFDSFVEGLFDPSRH